jgi:glycosyl-4,4'-diaponeurosporenoate acyltransferase
MNPLIWLYRDWMGVRRWKSRLPDGAPWLGGFAKKRLFARDTEYLRHFVLETRRAEVAHWCMLGCLPVFFLWNPPWACGVMSAYAVAANLPCILTQRYNRLALHRVAQSRRRRFAQS